MSKKKKDLTELSSRLQELFTHKNWTTLWQTYNLVQKWPGIVGKDIAKKSEPAYILNDTLWIYVESSVFMQHMQMQKLQLLAKINNIISGAEIQDVRWAIRPGKPAGVSMRSATRKTYKPDPEEKKAFEAIASTVEDEQCREALKKLWNTYNNG